MIGDILAIYGSTVFFLLFGSTILFLTLLGVFRKREAQYRTFVRYFKVYSIIVLGVLVLFGGELISLGVTEVLSGEPGGNPWITIGGGLAIITIVGVAFYVFFIAGPRALRKFESRKKEHPNAPWMWVDEWLERRIVYSGTGNLVFVWFVIPVVIFGGGFVWYMNRAIILAKMQSSSRFEVIAFALLMLFILVPALLGAVSWTRGQLKYGKSIFELSTYPGIVGGELAGTIYTRMKEIPKDGFKVQLACELTERSSGRSSNTSTVFLWAAERKVLMQELKMGPEGVSIPVSFSIPPGAEESDLWMSHNRRIDWTLSAFSGRKGTQYLSQFNVPVFKAWPKA
ncbi:MAG: hypothetical protein EHM36_06800 [Deltaproteobacteria bacterium]|nr:MAG: hypothetical protein EHM36_06800 [Deltaproteobacteria bacterium]